jgi:cytochrome c oxidase subunit 2
MFLKRPRRYGPVLLVAVALLALAACGEQQYPNSTFNPTSDLNIAIKALWDRLLFFGTIVFVFVEVLLIFTIIKFRKREGSPEPKQVHGNPALEITWTAIPALILVMIAVPTVKTIFKTQAKAPAGALQVEVIGHQWWWEFRYPQQGIVTANELYIPAGRTVNFQLNSRDVLHSFWTPQLGGKRDLITNRTNWLWYTPDSSLSENVFNGFCTEYCGSSHANMRFRVYTVSADKFASWATHQATAAAMSPVPVTPAAAPAAGAVAGVKTAPTPVVAAANVAGAPAAAAPAPSEGYVFPLEKMAKEFPHTVPRTPLPRIAFDESVLAQGDAERGRALFTNMAKAPCLTCHVIKGEMAVMKDDQARGPNLTHFASRHTFAGGLFATSPKALALWIKNAPQMKPGSIMPTLGTGQYNAAMKMTVTTGGLDDRQIADIVAYLMALK